MFFRKKGRKLHLWATKIMRIDGELMRADEHIPSAALRPPSPTGTRVEEEIDITDGLGGSRSSKGDRASYRPWRERQRIA